MGVELVNQVWAMGVSGAPANEYFEGHQTMSTQLEGIVDEGHGVGTCRATRERINGSEDRF